MLKRSVRGSVAVLLASAAAFWFAMASGPSAFADEPKTAGEAEPVKKLGVGDPAPGLEIEHWVKGDPVAGFEKGRVYVVEFWATWCGPCIVSIPHLTEMAHKFKKDGVTMIGISSSDKNLEVVQEFVKDMGDKMDYVVAVDRKVEMKGMDRAVPLTSRSYMEASAQRGIPCSFVVDRDSKIAWIGHPMSYLESVVEDVVAGKFDSAKQQEMEAKAGELMGAASKAARAGEWDQMRTRLGEYRELHRSHGVRADRMEFFALLTGKKDYSAAYALGDKLVTGTFKDDAMMLNEMSWMILTGEEIEERDLDLAMKAAVRANELTKGQDAGVLDTLARAHFDKGEVAKAIEIQTRAVEFASNDEMKEELQATLERYLEAQKSK